MLNIERVGRAHRAASLALAGTIAYLALAVWGVVNLLEEDWLIGGLFLASAVVGLPALLGTVRRVRREERRSASAARRQDADAGPQGRARR